MNTQYGNCPKCEKPVHHVNVVSIPAQYPDNSQTYAAIGFVCQECDCIISIQIYPWKRPDIPGEMPGI